ncbi:CHAD domain-containing protein [Chryseobacterium sp. MDT2-18]|uniref:CHAD domain-containing protein n=1 Tax=Chryseobacterium sp. MDT2-18 TaxID=1259136 RepID=UPI0027869FD9|nr:CHAD domain-containing protein [Chryseobacterium sp. MDT2-18]MDQ0477057.1 CHAD domain-containing protein [Chryseobacterium sp. MDT2-18]
MEKNLLKYYIFKRLESVGKHLSAYPNDRKPKHIHGLRLDIKMIKAVFSFAGKVYQQKYDATRLRPLFREAGKIRVSGISIPMLASDSGIPKKLISRLQKKEDLLVRSFISNCSKYTFLIRDFRKEISLPEKLPGNNIIKKYFKNEIKKATQLLKLKDREKMHRYRMKIKKIMYLYNALPPEIQKKIHLNEAEIKKQEKKLGKWHDTYSAMKFLSPGYLLMEESPGFSNIKEKEKKQFNALFAYLRKKSLR